MARDDNPERNADGNCKEHGYANEPNVFERGLHNFALMPNKEINEVHSPSRLLRTSGNSQHTRRPTAPEPTKTPWPKRFRPIFPRPAMRSAWEQERIGLSG